MPKSSIPLRVLFFLVFLVPTQVLFAQSTSSTVFRFLDVPTNARTAALSANHVSLFDADFSLFQSNPAYLTKASSGQVAASYVNHLADANFGFVTGAWHINNIGTLGLGIRYAGYGEFERIDENGVSNGTFSPGDIALTAGIGRELAPKLRGGASIDAIYSAIDSFTSTAVAVSAGFLYEDIEKHLSIGFAVRNLGSQLSTFNGEQEPLPLDVAVGVTHKPQNFPIRGTILLRRLHDWDLRVNGENTRPDFADNFFRHLVLGGEILFTENFNFRVGYNQLQHEQLQTRENFDFAGVGFGVGLKVNKFFIDISRSSFSELGGIFQISIKTRIKKSAIQ